MFDCTMASKRTYEFGCRNLVESAKGKLYPGRTATKKIFDEQSDATEESL
jgi:hypothetical protein